MTLWFIVFTIAFASFAPSLPAQWQGIDAHAATYGVVLATNYLVLVTVVREGLMNGSTEVLTLFVIGGLHSIKNAVEWNGFLGLSTLYVGFSFAGGRLKQWIRDLFVVTGLVVLADILLGSAVSVALTQIPLAVASIALPLATALLTIRFRRCACHRPARRL